MFVLYIKELNGAWTTYHEDREFHNNWLNVYQDELELDCNESLWIIPGTFHLLED